MLWYHDHTAGITRLNTYAGLAGMYIIRDEEEHALDLPSGDYEIPLMIADKDFNEDGSLFYPDQTNVPPPPHPDDFPDPSVTPGSAFNKITVNGKVWPYLEVEQRKYRFRIVNASNERFYRMALSSEQPFVQIGSDGGLLEKPVELHELLIAPAERVDIIVDFSDHPAGTEIILTNTATVPFDFEPPIGQVPDPETDGLIMQFKVIPRSKPDKSSIPSKLAEIKKFQESEAVQVRDITLDVENDQFGRLRFLFNKKGFMERIIETPVLNDIEIWRIINPAGAHHPIHIHLVQFQILDRIPIDVEAFDSSGEIRPAGEPELPPPNERGWKDTVQAPPGFMTRLIMRFGPFTGRYVYHCHILEHEDYDMMRPFKVIHPAERGDAGSDCKDQHSHGESSDDVYESPDDWDWDFFFGE